MICCCAVYLSTACTSASVGLISLFVSVFHPQPPAIKVSCGFSTSLSLFLHLSPPSYPIISPLKFASCFHLLLLVSVVSLLSILPPPYPCLCFRSSPLLHVLSLMERRQARQVWLGCRPRFLLCVCLCGRGQMCRCVKRSENLFTATHIFANCEQLHTARVSYCLYIQYILHIMNKS